MSNTFLTISMITKEALRVLENNLKFTSRVNRTFDDKFGIDGAKIGNTINIRKPPRYVGRTGQAMVVEGITETSVPLVLDTQFGVDIQFSSTDLALNIDDFSSRILKPAVATVANRIDFLGLSQFDNVNHFVGAPGVTPNTLLLWLQSIQKLDEESAPQDDLRTIIMNPAARVAIVDALKGLFQAGDAISKQYMSGNMGTAIGAEWVMDQNINVHTVGALGSTPLVNGAGQSGSSLITDGWTSAAATRLLKGDVIDINALNSVNPQNRQSTGSLQQFVVTADTASDASGNMTIPIAPDIVTSGAFQNVNTSVADNAAIRTFGHASSFANINTPNNGVFHRDAFALGTADLPLPKGTDMASRVSSKQLGISLRMIRDYDITSDQFPCRIDVLFGWTTLYRELACRQQG